MHSSFNPQSQLCNCRWGYYRSFLRPLIHLLLRLLIHLLLRPLIHLLILSYVSFGHRFTLANWQMMMIC
jgi:hypothetical protein